MRRVTLFRSRLRAFSLAMIFVSNLPHSFRLCL
nr:MAG TPA: hypothetical protein [Microviridae sp.]